MPLSLRNLLAVVRDLASRDALEWPPGTDGIDPVRGRIRQQPTAYVRVGDGGSAVAAMFADQIFDQLLLQLRGGLGNRAVQRCERIHEDRLVLRKDRIERRVARDAPERDVGHRPAVERQPLAVGLPFAVDSLDPGAAGIARHIVSTEFTEPVVVELCRHQPVFGQRQCYPARIDGDPPPCPTARQRTPSSRCRTWGRAPSRRGQWSSTCSAEPPSTRFALHIRRVFGSPFVKPSTCQYQYHVGPIQCNYESPKVAYVIEREAKSISRI